MLHDRYTVTSIAKVKLQCKHDTEWAVFTGISSFVSSNVLACYKCIILSVCLSPVLRSTVHWFYSHIQVTACHYTVGWDRTRDLSEYKVKTAITRTSCPSIHPSIHPSINQSIHPSIRLYLSACPCINQSTYLPTHLPTYLPTYLPICLSVCLSVCLSIYLSISAHLAVWLTYSSLPRIRDVTDQFGCQADGLGTSFLQFLTVPE
jgi:hypothetical protein